MKLEDIYKAKPFTIRNAEELELTEILTRFVDPHDIMTEHFNFENKIVKGRKGSGKTMYLKANYAHNFFEIIPNLNENKSFTVPILLQLNEFATIKDKDKIYKLIILRIIQKVIDECKNVYNLRKLNPIHSSLKLVPILNKFYEKSISEASLELLKLSAEKYENKIGDITRSHGTLGYNVSNISHEVEKNYETLLSGEKEPSIRDLDEIYNILLKEHNGRILLLIDETSSLNQCFFISSEGESHFEILMNQFRTKEYLRTKVAIYSDHYSDILQEIRYGDVLRLEENVKEITGYKRFRSLTNNLIRNYLTSAVFQEFDEQEIIEPEIVFNIEINGDDCIEKIIFASDGNMRRLVSLLNLVMITSFKSNKGEAKVNKGHVSTALKLQSYEMEKIVKKYQDIEFIEKITQFCRKKKTYRFQFPNKSVKIKKFFSSNREFNLIDIDYNSGYCNIYSFDYSYCITHSIPTHVNSNGAIDNNRSFTNSAWIKTAAKISDEKHLSVDEIDRIYGTVLSMSKNNCIIKGDDKHDYEFSLDDIITKTKPIIQNNRVKFIPGTLSEPSRAFLIELVEISK